MVQAGSGDESNSESDQNSGGSDNDTTKSDNDTTKSDNDTTKDSDAESKRSAAGSGSEKSSKSSGSESNSNNSSDDSDSSRASSGKSKSVGGAPSSPRGGRSSDDDSSPPPTPKKRKDERVWEENPDIYGIRRSGRSRKEPERLQPRKPEHSDESDGKGRRGGGRRKSAQSKDTWNSDSSDYDSETDKESHHAPRRAPSRPKPSSRAAAASKKRAPPAPSSRAHKRSKLSSTDSESYDSDESSKKKPTRRNARPVKSYKEDSDKTDSDDLLEVDQSVEVEEAVPDNAETIERVIASRRGKKGVVGSVTTAYYVEEHGDANTDCDTSDKEEQFLIKWKGWSHIHNTWESEESLKAQEVKGLKKLENFKKKEEELAYWRQHTTPEDVEYFECQLELQSELMKSYNHVERIIADRKTPDIGHEYFVKWESLPYAEATWEEAGLIRRKWPQKIKEFREREDSTRTPSKLTRALKYRPKFRQVLEQPEYMGGDQTLVLRDYQVNGLNWMIHAWCKENSVILADEMGLGKTIQTICFLYYLFHAHDLHGPFLVVVPLSTMAAWQREFQLWAPEMNVVTYLGDVGSRNIIRDFEWTFASSQRLKFNAILTTYEILLKDKSFLNTLAWAIRDFEWTFASSQRLKFNAILTTYEILLKDKSFLNTLAWAVLMVDEAHRLKNDDSLLYRALAEFKTNHRLLITGTPLQNSLKELWALLHFIMPNKFDSWEEFEKEHDNAANKGYQKLHKQLEPFILRRVKKDVEKSLPAKVEQILRVEMTGLQKQYYKWILTKNFSALKKGNKGSTTTFLNIMIELKKCCNHAFLTKRDESEPSRNTEDYLKTLVRGSGKLVLLDKLLVRLRETGHRVLIFSQMVRMLDILAEYLQLRHFTFQRLDGSIKGEIRRQALDHFNAEGSPDFCFLLSTRAGGLGINLATADTVIIFDSDWNPQNDLQAQARAHRIGQKNQVNIYRLVTAESVEEDIVERAKRKMVLDHLVIQRMDTTGRTVLDKKAPNQATPFNKDELTAILKFGAERLFNNEEENGDEDPICDIDEILRRAELRDEAPATVGDELLSAFKVASFATNTEEEAELGGAGRGDGEGEAAGAQGEEESKDWDDIIPEKLRRRVEEEEKAKEMEDLYLPPRSRKTLQQVNQSDEEGGEGRRGRKRRGGEDKEEGSGGEGGEGDSSYDEDESDDERPKKRGRPKANSKESVKGFTDAEIRRFVKSFKKFPASLKRLEAVACDAELQEKPLADLRRLGETLLERCRRSMEESASASTVAAKENEASHQNNEDSNLSATKKTRTRAPTCKLGGVTVNAKSVVTCSEELQPLDSLLPASGEERAQWLLDVRVKATNFDVEWGAHEDSKLLLGIYQYGLGSWEAIKMDPSLGISDKILSNEDKKPQAKHLLLRAEYLLRVLKKKMAAATKPAKTRKRRGGKEAKALTKEIVEEDNSSGGEEGGGGGGEKKEAGGGGGEDKKKKPREVKKKKKVEGPMHFTANSEPRALDVLGDLDPSVFNECKEKMRPVKKALRALDSPDTSLSPEDQMAHTLHCLRQIGEQINKTLATYKDPAKVNEWRSNLWYFVSKFTEYDAKKLFKLYKHAVKRGGGGTGTEASSKSTTPSTTPVKKEKKEKEHKHHHKEKEKHNKEKEEKKEEKKKKKRKHEEPEDEGEVKEKEKHKREKSKEEGSKKVKLEDGAEEIKRERKDSDRRGGDRSEDERERDRDRGSSKYSRNSANSQNSDPRGSGSRGSSNWQTSSSSNSRYASGYEREGYSSRSSGYGRERDRGERAHSRYDDKRSRYHPPAPGYPPYGAPPPPGALYYPPGAPIDPHLAGGWERYPPNVIPPPGGYSDWRPKERDYRRGDYDRRPATSNS